MNQETTGVVTGRSASVRRPGTQREPLLLEAAWEVCNKVGGIYTVLQSKVRAMQARWGERYCLVGPFLPQAVALEFEPAPLAGPFGEAVARLHELGVDAHFGRWLVDGRPHVILLDHLGAFGRLHEIKYRLWSDHGIGLPGDDELLNNVAAFGDLCRELMFQLTSDGGRPVVAHFHEWMAGAAVPMLRQSGWPGTIVFTTHATLLGRFLAMNDEWFYEHLPTYDPGAEATRYQVEPQWRIEQSAAHGAHVFTTVSDVTAEECRHLLGRRPDVLLPNGLNIQRFTALHEFHNLHRQYKEKIHEFTIGHFFPSYSFDLERTLYFFTSGRFEYRNKGMDLTVDALARLNQRLMHSDLDVTVVTFIITRRPVRSIDVAALQSRAMLEEFRTCVDAVKQDVGERLFLAAAEGRTPDLDTLVEDYWRLRLRRAIAAWRRDVPPGIMTHVLEDDQHDEVLNQLRACRLWNEAHDRVKVIYHPHFISTSNPLLAIEYEQFVRGCHLGIFPSYYEPWGYTPLESIALGVPAVTSDLSGFGSYLKQLHPQRDPSGILVLDRRHRGFQDASEALAQHLHEFCRLDRRERMAQRNEVEQFSGLFDWSRLATCYHEAYELALDRVG